MKIDYRGSSKILKRLAELVNRSQNIALRQDNTDKNTLYWTGLDGVEITVNIPSGAVEVDTELSETSTNPVENQAITKELAQKADKSAIPTVGNGVLSVQRNGKSVGTFSANAAENVSVNIPVPEKVSELENDAGYGTYTKPTTGIPKSDLASGVQASLGKADTALQKHQDISGKVDNTAAGADSLLSKITNSWTAAPTDNTYFIRQDTSSKNEFGRVKFSTLWSYIKSKVESLGYTKNTGTITGIKMNGASKGTSGVVDLGTVITAHQDISGKQDKSTAVTHTANTAVGSATKPVYIAANGSATPISHSINADVPANAKFTDTTYSDATTSKAGLMSATDKTNLNANTLARHTHSNKATLDKLTDAQLTKLDGIAPDLYLPKAGGVMTGDIDMQTNKKDILVGTQPASAYGTFTPVSSGQITTDKKFVDLLPTMRSYMGTYNYKTSSEDAWYDLISVRHRNGYGDGSHWGMIIYANLFGGNLQWNLNTNKDAWQGGRTLLDSINFDSYAAKSNHTHAMITNSALWVSGANNTAKWVRIGTLVSSGNFSNGVIRVWTGNGANGNANQNSSFEIQIKDGWQSTDSATKSCGVTVYRISCSNVKVKVIPTAHDTYTVWAYMPWGYWNGNYAVYGKYKSWTSQHLIQSDEPEGTGADTAYYDQAFLTSTVAKATEATALAETAWTAVPTAGAAETVGRSIKYLKSGNTVFVQGSISFSASLNTPVCGTMPSDCLPNQKLVFTGWDIIGAPASFAIILDTDGKLSFLSPGTTAYWFKDHRAYSFNFSYHIN